MMISTAHHRRIHIHMCQRLDHCLQAHLAQCPVITQGRGSHQMRLFVNQSQHCNHRVPEDCDRHHQEYNNRVFQGLILPRHQSNRTTWQRSNALTAARIPEGSRATPVANSHGSPTGQRPASKTQTKTKHQLLAGFSRPSLNLQL